MTDFTTDGSPMPQPTGLAASGKLAEMPYEYGRLLLAEDGSTFVSQSLLTAARTRIAQLEAELATAKAAMRETWNAMQWPMEWVGDDGTAKNSIGAVCRLPEIVGRLHIKNEELLKNAGFGGHSSEAPDEMWIYGRGTGCDRWIHLSRATVYGGKADPQLHEHMKQREADGPVRYVRADPAAVSRQVGAEGAEK